MFAKGHLPPTCPKYIPSTISHSTKPLTASQIGEVGRIVHYIRKHLLNRTIKTCSAFDDEIVYGKVGTSASAFSKALEGRRVTGADQQGKYFYVTFDKPPHAVMHFGMTGWMKFSVEDTAYYKQAKEEGGGKAEEWPPKYMKFLWKCEAEGGREACEVAFVDARRLARIRLVECEAGEIRNVTPLKENGPDPVRDKEVLTVGWLAALMRRKRVPVKALLLDQANLSGVGNWVADEILYQARIHPEQYSNTLSEGQIKALHEALISVCTIAVETLADSKKFPDDWIMKYRWDKGKKDANVLPNGEKIVHITVGGRTSAVVPSRQKKTGPVAGDVGSGDEKPAKGRKRKSKAEEDVEEGEEPAAKKGARGKKGSTSNGVKREDAEPQVNGGAEETPAKKGRGSSRSTPKNSEKPTTPASRRSARTKT